MNTDQVMQGQQVSAQVPTGFMFHLVEMENSQHHDSVYFALQIRAFSGLDELDLVEFRVAGIPLHWKVFNATWLLSVCESLNIYLMERKSATDYGGNVAYSSCDLLVLWTRVLFCLMPCFAGFSYEHARR